MNVLSVKGLTHVYGQGTSSEAVALNNCSFDIEKGELVAIIGHTGSGKSTLIQHFNGLLKPSKGQILLNGKDINENKQTVVESRFKVGLCFQYPEYQLFEETVRRDIAFGPKNMKLSEEEINRRVLKCIEYVGLDESYLEKSPFDLSGGEKRRVAIAGVMAMEPEILVLDEPTAGLDPQGRDTVFELIKEYRRKTGSTVIIVSHSMEDVARLATKALVMNKGEVAMYGTIDEVYSRADELVTMGLNVPQITRIFMELKKAGLPINGNIYTVEQGVEEIIRLQKEGYSL
ncbi:MAG: energy-coupling factor transporter ATPase [Ruminococcaceae bacterium]|nr:energy-coupling factor transporter ATPase [Oscillospiraceae bacterium]